MKITEIERVNVGGVNLDHIVRNHERPAGFNGEIDGFSFFKARQGKYNTFYLVDHDTVIAATVGTIQEVDGKNYYQISGVFVLPKYRGTDLAIKIYHAIMHSYGYHLMSDGKQTPAGEKLWKKLSRAFPVKVMRLPTGDIISDNPMDAYDENVNTVLVTEEKIQKNSLLIPHLKIKENTQW